MAATGRGGMRVENRLKRRLRAGEPLYGCWVGLASPGVAEVLACSAYDFLILDLEHGPGTLQDAIHMLRACEARGMDTIVRVPWNDQVYLKRILDAGARGVMVPMVETAEEARAAVAACRYPPLGSRGYAAPAMRCSGYGMQQDYLAWAAEELLITLQIESVAAAGRAEAIAGVEGVDLGFIGVNDLAGSIGLLEQLDRPEVDALVRQAEAGIRAAGKPLGSVPSARRDSAGLFADGYLMVGGAGDSGLLREAARRDVEALRARLKGG